MKTALILELFLKPNILVQIHSGLRIYCVCVTSKRSFSQPQKLVVIAGFAPPEEQTRSVS